MPRSCAPIDAIAPRLCDETAPGVPLGWVLAWLLLVLGGGLPLWSHLTSPGDEGQPPDRWPATAELDRLDNVPTVLLFAHPQCPCTRASLSQLAMIVARSDTTAMVIFHRPEGAPLDWRDGGLVNEARGMSRVRVVWDDGGRLCRSFGVQTSGHVLVYSRDGSLQYSGGITAGRGHEGANSGRHAVLACLQTSALPTHRQPVFGCPLAGANELCRPPWPTTVGDAP